MRNGQGPAAEGVAHKRKKENAKNKERNWYRKYKETGTMERKGSEKVKETKSYTANEARDPHQKQADEGLSITYYLATSPSRSPQGSPP